MSALDLIIKPGSEQRYWLYYCGVTENKWRNGHNGIAIAISEKARYSHIEWKSANNRVAHARFKGFYNISVINVYALTLCADDSDKIKFYAELQLLTTSLQRGDIVIIGELECARMS
ncbi:unnamed protein product [Dracunculus medinensis]|uniref:DUF3421 domain-containing protein n=1 Tax=Dracunculus medinensis TaxID=318479 RepID=A0A0N4U9S3_DRAME|nr:unnamed protein product [Dracunculus medinensis]